MGHDIVAKEISTSTVACFMHNLLEKRPGRAAIAQAILRTVMYPLIYGLYSEVRSIIHCEFAPVHWFIIHSIEYVTDPNATILSERWLNLWPS